MRQEDGPQAAAKLGEAVVIIDEEGRGGRSMETKPAAPRGNADSEVQGEPGLLGGESAEDEGDAGARKEGRQENY